MGVAPYGYCLLKIRSTSYLLRTSTLLTPSTRLLSYPSNPFSRIHVTGRGRGSLSLFFVKIRGYEYFFRLLFHPHIWLLSTLSLLTSAFHLLIPGSGAGCFPIDPSSFFTLLHSSRDRYATTTSPTAADSYTPTLLIATLDPDFTFSAMSSGALPLQGQSLGPLAPSLRSGLIAITVLACISFFAAATLFIYLTYKIVAWQLFVRRENEKRFRNQHHVEDEQEQPVEPIPHRARHEASSSQYAADFALGIDGVFGGSRPSESKDASIKGDGNFLQQDPSPPIRPLKGSPNQFLILIYNLLIADLHQATAFALNSTWINRNAILVDTKTCWAQGFFVSVGDLSSSMFITLIAVHTFFSVVRGYRPSQRTLYVAIGLVWLFVYFISTLPIAMTRNGREHGGLFVRAGAWCWINNEYGNYRLFTHYLWIFIALGVTSGLYIAIWYSLHQQARRRRAANPDGSADTGWQGDHNPAFLIYPVIYVTCTLPLATERVASMAGAEVPLGFFCFAGALISLNGFFDCLLFGTTRHSIIFASKYDLDAADTGVKTIAFLQTPKARRYGNMVWIQGGQGGRRKPEPKTTGGWWSWQRLAGQSGSLRGEKRRRPRGSSQESLRGPGIQMDLVTTVVVEVEEDKERDIRYPDPAASASPSVNSTERDAISTRAI
ncbi:G protein-coupled glucose receptor regulating Gpa2 domain-containing protein [Trichoderma ceciliae]